MTAKRYGGIFLGLLLGLAPPLAARADDALLAAYQRAAALLPTQVTGLVKNEAVRPQWLENGEFFWYMRDTEQGVEYVLVRSATGERQPAFDHAALAATLSRDTGTAISPHQLTLQSMILGDDGLMLSGHGRLIRCVVDGGGCTSSPAPVANPLAVSSPDGAWQVMRQDHDMVLHAVDSGKSTPITSDGRAGASYGEFPDLSLITLTAKRQGWPLPPFATFWSPDSRYLVFPQIITEEVAEYPFMESAPRDGSTRPRVYTIKRQVMGDQAVTKIQQWIYDRITGMQRQIQQPDGLLLNTLSLRWWTNGGRILFIIAQERNAREVSLVRIDMNTGQTDVILRESSQTNIFLNQALYKSPNVHVLRDGKEAIWYSERDNWGHIYLYDIGTGKLKRQITRGPWSVHDILLVDEANRQVFFTAAGRERTGAANLRRIYRASLDRDQVVLLTPEDVDHDAEPASLGLPGLGGLYARAGTAVAPNGRYFVDSQSTLSAPPVSLLRDARNGRVIAELERADASALYARGFRPPLSFTVTAADGKTPLNAVVYLPPDHDPVRKYPVIDALYAGPQIAVVPRTFYQAYYNGIPTGMASLAELGFIVVVIDASSVPYQSRDVRNRHYGDVRIFGIPDHIAALKQLAEKFPSMDLGRVGVFGHSFGGYVSARAILEFPDFFKVAVSSAGPQRLHGLYPGNELYFGPPVYEGGQPHPTTPGEIPVNYRGVDNTLLADNLQGHLMLAYGEMDENVPPDTILQLADALNRAHKPYDLLYLANQTHGFSSDPYFLKRQWDYFVRHLHGIEPPAGFKIGP